MDHYLAAVLGVFIAFAIIGVAAFLAVSFVVLRNWRRRTRSRSSEGT